MTTVGKGLWFVEIEAPTDPEIPSPGSFPLRQLTASRGSWDLEKAADLPRLAYFLFLPQLLYYIRRHLELYGIFANCGEMVGDSRRWRGRLQYAGSGSSSFHSWVSAQAPRFNHRTGV